VTSSPLAYTSIVEAAARLRGVTRQTPLVEDDLLNQQLGGRLLFKCEPLQRTGSFKLRGAFNAVSQAGKRPVVAFSSGNHAQGVALAAKLCGVAATIVMPTDAPTIKQSNTRAYGATVRTYDRHRDDREAIGAEIAEESAAALIRPYDDIAVIAGQGTVGLEMAEACRQRAIEPDLAIVCCGGGGLIAGTATALRQHFPSIEVYAAEPAGFDDTARSLVHGRRLLNDPAARSICDALLAPTPGELTFAINRTLLSGGLAVSDDEVRAAMRIAFERLKLVVEPGGAVAMAAALSGRLELRGRTALIVLSGGNVDRELFGSAIAAGA